VVGDPSGGIHVAELGRGECALDRGAQRPLVPSDESNIVVIKDSHADEARRERAARFMADVIRADRWDLRSLSTTLALPYVAAGRIASYVLFWSSPLVSMRFEIAAPANPGPRGRFAPARRGRMAVTPPTRRASPMTWEITRSLESKPGDVPTARHLLEDPPRPSRPTGWTTRG
jgi:hypothetical protein